MLVSIDPGIEIKKLNDKLTIYRLKQSITANEFENDIRTGLSSKNKYLLPKYFYDDKGSMLFEKITQSEEYYLTRTELSILENMSGLLPQFNHKLDEIIELGSGNAQKTQLILNTFAQARKDFHFVPIDVSDILVSSSKAIQNQYNNVHISGIISDYYSGLNIQDKITNGPKLFIFLGSSIGNFRPEERQSFFRIMQDSMSNSDFFLVGFDMIKDVQILENAYDDSQNITAEFNQNLLNRINNEFDADFDLEKFSHLSLFNNEESRIEMHLVSKEQQQITIDKLNMNVHFEKNQRIHTENSYKFSLSSIEELASLSGMQIQEVFTDERKYFSLVLFKLIDLL